MESNVKSRLLEFIQATGTNVSQFQQKIQVSPSYVQNMVNGIGTPVLKRIEKEYPDLNTEWLLEGIGDMYKDAELDECFAKTIPILPISAQAGRLNDFTQYVKEYQCEKIISPIDDAQLAVTVCGDSMSPEFPNGSKVLVKKINETAFIDWGRTYVLDTCNGIVIKNVFPSITDGKIRCVSVNREYPEFEIYCDDIYGWYLVLMSFALK